MNSLDGLTLVPEYACSGEHMDEAVAIQTINVKKFPCTGLDNRWLGKLGFPAISMQQGRSISCGTPLFVEYNM